MNALTRRYLPLHLASMIACLAFAPPMTAFAACSDHAPASGTNVICDTNAPNPDTTGVVAPTSTGVTVTVQSSAGIATASSSAIELAAGTITNSIGATLSSTGSSIPTVYFSQGGQPDSSLDNDGTITAASADTVNARSGLHVINRSGASITSASNGSALDMGSGGSVDNYGMLSGNAIAAIRIYNGGTVTNFSGGIINNTDNDGVYLANGSMLTNHDGASISGANKGAEITGANSGDPDIVINGGTIESTGLGTGSTKAGIFFYPSNPAGILNEASGVITGPIGIYAPSSSDPMRIRNAGTIVGTDGTAIQMENDGNTLTLVAGFIQTGSAVANGNGNTLALAGADDGAFDAGDIGPSLKYQGFEFFAKRETSAWTLTGNGAQDWTIEAGTLNIVGTIGSGTAAGGTTTIEASGTLSGNGTINSQTVQLNGGTIDLSNTVAGDVLTLGAALNANGGTLRLDAKLDSGLSADHLSIQGSLNMTAPILLDVRNLGGSGAPTTGDGILVVEVLGASPANAFQLAAPVIAGSYRYDLVQAANGNWYLRASSIAPIPFLNPLLLILLAGGLSAAAWKRR